MRAPVPLGEKPRLRLVELSPIAKGALIAKVKVILPCGLEISDIAVFEKDGRRWAQLPAEPMRDFAGQPLKDPTTDKARYRSSLKWSTKALQDGFSAAVIAAVEAEHGPLGQVVEPAPAPQAAPARPAAYRRPQPSDAPPSDPRPFDDEIPF